VPAAAFDAAGAGCGGGCAGELFSAGVKQGRSSFLKKRSKKLLSMVRASPAARANRQKFFGSFFQKRTLS
jgi:hypothetical protein